MKSVKYRKSMKIVSTINNSNNTSIIINNKLNTKSFKIIKNSR